MSQPSAGSAAQSISGRIEALADAAETAVDILPESREAARVLSSVRRVEKRFSLGVTHTVVALVGGTGSGKSAVFNAIAGMEFSEVGPLRPTTTAPTAAVWGEQAETLLDWLGVERERWIQRDSILDADDQQELKGLVLLDLPDYDSISSDHRDAVEMAVPLADLLVWVVDPQKYADQVLHSGFLQQLRGREESMIVLINQIDTVPPNAGQELIGDMKKLLASDGLTDVRILATSMATDEGMESLRQILMAAVGQPTTAYARAEAELREVAGRLRVLLGSVDTPRWVDEVRLETVLNLSSASGVDRIVSQLRSRGEPEPIELPSTATLSALRERWLGRALAELPEHWARAVALNISTTPNLATRLRAGLGQLSVPPSPTGIKAFFSRKKIAEERALEYGNTARRSLEGVVDAALTGPTNAVRERRNRAIATADGWLQARDTPAVSVQSAAPQG